MLKPEVAHNYHQIDISDNDNCFTITGINERNLNFSGSLPKNTELLDCDECLMYGINSVNIQICSNIITLKSYPQDGYNLYYENIIDLDEMTHRFEIKDCLKELSYVKISPTYTIYGNKPSGLGYEFDSFTKTLIISVFHEDGYVTKYVQFDKNTTIYGITHDKEQRRYQHLKEGCGDHLLDSIYHGITPNEMHFLKENDDNPVPLQEYFEKRPRIRCCNPSVIGNVANALRINKDKIPKPRSSFLSDNRGKTPLTGVGQEFSDCIINTLN